MNKYWKLIILLTISFSIQAQVNDTVWLDKKWIETVKDSAKYYRFSSFDEKNQRYVIKEPARRSL